MKFIIAATALTALSACMGGGASRNATTFSSSGVQHAVPGGNAPYFHDGVQSCPNLSSVGAQYISHTTHMVRCGPQRQPI